MFGGSGSLREQVVPPQVQPDPEMAVTVSPAGRLSVIVTVPEVEPLPLLPAVIVYAAPVCPWLKLPL